MVQTVKESACQCRRCLSPGFYPWVGKIPWRREWLPTLVFLLGEFHGQRIWQPKEDTKDKGPRISCVDTIYSLLRSWRGPASFIYTQRCLTGMPSNYNIFLVMWGSERWMTSIFPQRFYNVLIMQKLPWHNVRRKEWSPHASLFDSIPLCLGFLLGMKQHKPCSPRVS